jgi:HAE1 family hydrophobic/amphiphilic exporter-1
MLSSQMMKVPGESASKRNGFIQKFHDRSEKWFDGLANFYKNSLSWALGHRKTVIITGLAIFVVSLLLIRVVGTEFIPAMDQATVLGNVELPIGTRVEVTDEVMNQIEGLFETEITERELMFARCGISETGMGANTGGMRSDTNTLMVGARLLPKGQRKRSSAEIGYTLSKKIAAIPGIKTIDFGGQDMASSISGEKPVSVEIYGEDIEATDRVAAEVKELLESIPGTTDVTISRIGGKPELWIEVDRKKASALGLNMAQIAGTLRTKFQGQTATRYREGGEEYDTYVRLKESDRQSVEDIYNTFVTSPSGAQIPIANIARVVERTGPLTLERKDQERVVYVGAGLYGRALGEVVADLREGLSKVDLPEGVDYKIAGSAEDQAEAFNYLLLALILGVVLIYMVMAAQFESLLDPFIIMFSVPFAIVGVIWALLITGKTLNLISYVGMIMLIGIVVKNAIVLIDYINILRARGVGMWEAILTGGQDRLRPVLMTALTTILGLTPLALSRGEGSEVWSPLAISVIGGLLVSTIVTLIFVPTLYSIMEQKVKKNNKKA